MHLRRTRGSPSVHQESRIPQQIAHRSGESVARRPPHRVGLTPNAAILGRTMVQHPVPRAPQNDQPSRPSKTVADDLALTPKQQQALAHSRGRICKNRGCEICAPLRENRRLKKAQRKADTQTQLHAKGEPCGRTNCPVPICVRARHADVVIPADAVHGADEAKDGAAESPRRQHERHRAGLPCGIESCANKECVEAFAQERARRHRARRPCRSLDCIIPICVSSRTGG